MNAYDFVHLVIHAAGDRVQGRTMLQKMVYFVGALTDHLSRLGYRPHYYGPYSSDVAGAVQELRSLKFLEQQSTITGPLDNQGFEITRYDYSLTEEGKQLAEDKANANPEIWNRIKVAVKRLTDSHIKDYVRLAIAAKTDLLSRQAGQVLSPDLLKIKTLEHGWKEFTDTQYTEALHFLEFVGLKNDLVSS